MRSLPESIFLGKKKETASVVLETRAQPEPQMKMPRETRLLKNDGRKRPSVRQLFASPPCRGPSPMSVCFRSVRRRWVFPLPSFWLCSIKLVTGRGCCLNGLVEFVLKSVFSKRKRKWSQMQCSDAHSLALFEAQGQTQCKHQSN